MKKELKDTIVVELGQKLKEYPHFYPLECDEPVHLHALRDICAS